MEPPPPFVGPTTAGINKLLRASAARNFVLFQIRGCRVGPVLLMASEFGSSADALEPACVEGRASLPVATLAC